MESPFPGMDPYLEAPYVWPDFHASLSVAISNQLQVSLSPRYVATIVPYVAPERLTLKPPRFVHVNDFVFDDLTNATGTDTIAEIPTRYCQIKIRAVRDKRLATTIEILSPVNKRPGADAAAAYERKRREVCSSDAHLLEIDLLRGGKRPALLDPLPIDPYVILLSRADRRPEIEIWPLSLREAIPVVPVPLHYPDPDVPLDLGAALAQIYRIARYDLLVDYRQPPPRPPFPDADSAWVEERLRERGLRP